MLTAVASVKQTPLFALSRSRSTERSVIRRVVTGASGLVGAVLVRELCARRPGDAVKALYRSDTRALAGLDVETAAIDVGDAAALETAFRGAEEVVHCAAYISLDRRQAQTLQRINVEGTRNVVTACRQAGVRRLVHVSSAHALHQAPLDHPLDEARPLANGPSASLYALSKATAEQVVLDAGHDLETVIVNPTGIIGPYDFKPSDSGRMLFDLQEGKLPALLPGGHDWVDCRDVAAGIVLALERGRASERYLLSGRWATLTELASLVAGFSGVSAPRWVVPGSAAWVGAVCVEWGSRMLGKAPFLSREALHVLQSKNRSTSSAKARRELGYAPRPLEETIRDLVEWRVQTRG